MGKIDIVLPQELLIDSCDVQRSAAAGRDASGAPVVTWATVYSAIACTIELAPAGDPEIFGQKVMEFRATAYFGPLAPGGPLPDVRPTDRLLYGAWPNGQPTYIRVKDVNDELRNGTVLVVTGETRMPA